MVPSSPAAMMAAILVMMVAAAAMTKGDPFVRVVSPKIGSINGGTKLIIRGGNFPKTFSLTDPNIGTRAKLVSLPENGGAEYECDLYTPGITKKKTTCYTRPMPAGKYMIRVTVDGQEMQEHCENNPDNCIFTVTDQRTPTISAVEPRFGPRNTMLTVKGRFFTSRFTSNEIGTTNQPHIVRFLAGGAICEAKNLTTDEMYGSELTDGQYGYVKCVPNSDYVGNYNVSFIVEKYGRSLPTPDAIFPFGNRGLGMFQMYAEIRGLSASTGSLAGGLLLTVTGVDFDNTDSPVQVTIGGQDCQVKQLTRTEIVCETPAAPEPLPAEFTGNRGLLVTVVEGTTDFETATWSTGQTRRVDGFPHVTMATGPHVTKMEGVFTVPEPGGKFRFTLSVTGVARLTLSTFRDNTEVLSFTSNRASGQISAPVTLQAGQQLKMVVLVSSDSDQSEVEVTARHYDTNYLATQTGHSKAEVQRIEFSSVMDPEMQQLVVSSTGPVPGQNEVQTLTVAGSASGLFTLQFLGAHTSPMVARETDENKLKAALEALPSMFGYAVSVTRSVSKGKQRFTITFPVDLGNVPQLEAVPAGSSNGLILSVTTDVKGESTLESFQLTFGGSVTRPVAYNATSQQVQSAIEESAGVRCPAVFQGDIPLMNCETGSNCAGEPVADEEPFCGRFSVKNPFRLYNPEVSAEFSRHVIDNTRKYLCLAHKGPVAGLRLWYRYRNPGEDFTASTTVFDISVPEEALEDWQYSCFDAHERVTREVPKKMDYRMQRVDILRETKTAKDIFADDLILTSRHPVEPLEFATKLRMPQARPNGAFIQRVEVTGLEGSYDISITPYHCGNGFELFGILDGQLTEGSTAPENDSASFVMGSGGQAEVTRLSRASSPISGTFTVLFKGEESRRIKASVTVGKRIVEQRLAGVSTLGDVDVDISGNCSQFAYTVSMIGRGGDQELLQLDTKRVEGNALTTRVVTVLDGHLDYKPIPGDMLRTLHTTPQVTISVNNVPAACNRDDQTDAHDCAFSWDAPVTPTVTSVSPEEGCFGDTVTIAGTGFAGSGNRVIIGDNQCDVTSATSAALTCTLTDSGGAITGDPHNVEVIVPGKGRAAGSVTFAFVTSVTSVSPDSGGREGGVEVTLSGNCFGQNAVVLVGDKIANTKSRQTTEIIFEAPALDSAETLPVNKPILLEQSGSQQTTGFTFLYTGDDTPMITSISPSQAIASGGTIITVSGINFGSEEPNVTLGDVTLQVNSYTSTQVEAVVPAFAPGTYSLDLQVPGVGSADKVTSVPDISVIWGVASLSPVRGSMYGGTLLTITGAGFGTDPDLLEVTVGSHACHLEAVTDEEIICRVGDTVTEYTVTNQGYHRVYGTGFAYNPRRLTILTGDCVTWEWSLPPHVFGIAFGIYETVDDVSEESMPGGFALPGEKSANGNYRFCFNEPGEYFYWSGYVNEPYRTMDLRAEVKVIPRTSTLAELKVTKDGVEALYDTSTTPTRRKREIPADSPTCEPVTALIPDCEPTVDLNPTNSNGRFQFEFSECATPIVTSISRSTGTALDEITLNGTGFGSHNCQNEISYADVGQGLVTSSSASQLSFTIDPHNAPPPAVFDEFSVRVGNRGKALMGIRLAADRLFALLPSFWQMSPVEGSEAGGTLVTFTGSGLASDIASVAVSIGGKLCDVQTATATEVTCRTPPGDADIEVDVEIFTMTAAGSVEVACLAPQCAFLYSTDSTPVITAVTPDAISSSPATLTFNGTGFGTAADAVMVTVGGVQCTVTTVDDEQVECEVADVPAGIHKPEVRVAHKGNAKHDLTISSVLTVNSASPLEGSIYGGTVLTFQGHGFSSPSSVTIDGEPCAVTVDTASEIQCVTSAHAAGSADLVLTSSGVEYSTMTFAFSEVATPTVTTISPSEGEAGDVVTITGTGFSTLPSNNTVTIGGIEGIVQEGATETTLSVTLGNHMTGSYPVLVNVKDKGNSNDDVVFAYRLGDFTFSPLSGTTAGGQTLTLSGSGFVPGQTTVTVCDQVCTPVTGSTTAAQLLCVAPPSSSVDQTTSCEVKVSVNNLEKTAANQYTYDFSITPEITDVSPRRGGTAGGTRLTISGSGFGTSTAAVSVTVGGATCDVQTVTDTQITCTTNSAVSGDYQVDVNVGGSGSAIQTGAEYRFIDAWSSIYTWGGDAANMPQEGDLVDIPPGQILLLDINPPRLKMLIIRGTLVFDEKDLELSADNILITDGGHLQVGTEENPFLHSAIITLHGFVLSRELPLYGTKVLALRNGTLDLHGRPTPLTWTYLASDANVGDTSITLTAPVNWQVGNEIVIPSTSHRHTQTQTEVRTITEVNADGLTLTFADPLLYKHVSEEHSLGSGESLTTVALRAEVGLLSHNVVVRGAVNEEWLEEVEACPNGFYSGPYQTQTCFLGRFGSEIINDQFGAQIMVQAAYPDSGEVLVRMSHVEIHEAGQAFRVGRYPVNFQQNGDVSGSYVKGVAIHHSYNRAVGLQGTSNLLVERSVVYNVMGSAFFLEEGTETGNTFQYNLVVFVRPSSSLLNVDLSPSAFLINNPNNTVIHNAVAAGSHYGYWYHLSPTVEEEEEEVNPTVCPQHVPLGRFENNTVHSVGRYGLWIFETYLPRVDGSCDSAPTQVAVFKSLTAWNCEKGAESVITGALQFKDFILVNNEKAGWEAKILSGVPRYSETLGPTVDGGAIVAHLGDKLDQEGGNPCTTAGVVLPFLFGLMVKDVNFFNFDNPACSAFGFTLMPGRCTQNCGGFTHQVKGLGFDSTTNKAAFRWASEGVILDLDGSLTSVTGGTATALTPIHPPANCQSSIEMSFGAVEGTVCDSSVWFHRMAWTRIEPDFLVGDYANLTNQYGVLTVPFEYERVTHRPGWQADLVSGECYQLEFGDSPPLINISFDATFYQFCSAEDVLCFTVKLTHRPDRFMLDGETHIPMVEPLPSKTEAEYGDWFYDDATNELTFYIKRPGNSTATYCQDLWVRLRIYRCFYEACIPPPNVLAVNNLPAISKPWSYNSSWTWRGWKPLAGEGVVIPEGVWIEIDEELPELDYLIVYGALSVHPDLPEFTLSVRYLHIYGRFIVGWEDNPYQGLARIILRGQQTDAYDSAGRAGAKAIAVYGVLDLHGKDPGLTVTRLRTTVYPGDATLTVEDRVTWNVGDEIVLTTTSADPWQTETFRLTDVRGKVLTLNSSVQYRHVAHTETLTSGPNVKLTARVALLTRNIRIESEEYDDLEQESFGAHVLVTRTLYNDEIYSGSARLSNVEFYRTGQFGYTDLNDPRYSVSFVDVVNDYDHEFMYSYVDGCSFHNGFSSAVGVFAVGDLRVTGNVMHHVVDKGIHTNSMGTQIENNLITLSVWPGTYLGRYQTTSYDYGGAVHAADAKDIILRNNVVTGCERTAYLIPAQTCDETANNGQGPSGEAETNETASESEERSSIANRMSSQWSGNEAHSCLIGVDVSYSSGSTTPGTCIHISGFTLWKNVDWGMVVRSEASQLYTDNVLVENGAGLLSFVIGPNSTAHEYADKFVEVADCVFIGRTSTFDPAEDSLDPDDPNIRRSSQSRSWRLGADGNGMSGIVFPSFISAGNRYLWDKYQYYQVFSDPSIKGITKIHDVTFKGYNTGSGSFCDYVISTNEGSHDLQHPMYLWDIDLKSDVEDQCKVYIHRPDLSKINPSDCVDMDCDGLKKVMVVDEDGSFLGGTGGYVHSDSAFEWDGDPQRGLGDYRIPKPFYAAPDGGRLDPADIAPYHGIYGTQNCTWQADAHAYFCDDSVDYAMLIMESLDADYMTRRLSPVAVQSGSYIDLINGPQDHSWCSEYSCMLRLSTFASIVPLELWVNIYLTGTNPQKMRFMLLNVREDECVGFSLYTTDPNRLDVYVGEVRSDNYKLPKNMKVVSGRHFMKPADTPDQFRPDLADRVMGENYIDFSENKLYWVQCGALDLYVQRAKVIIVSFALPAMTVDEFYSYGDSIVYHLAQFLRIDVKKVRVVNVVRERSDGLGRRRRSANDDTPYVTVEISDTPTDTSPPLDLDEITEQLVTQIQVGGLDVILNTTVAYTAVLEPDAAPGSTPTIVERVGTMVLTSHPVGATENWPFAVQPRLEVHDQDGNIVQNLGRQNSPWQVQASIKSGGDGRATLLGNTTVTFVNGTATFTDLEIDRPGDYVLLFEIVQPPQASNYSLETLPVTVRKRQLKVDEEILTPRILVDSSAHISLYLIDAELEEVFTDVSWRGHNWTITASITDPDVYDGILTGTTTASFDTTTGRADFLDLQFTRQGICPVTFTVTSDPPEYVLEKVLEISVMTRAQSELPVEKSAKVGTKFPIDYDAHTAPLYAIKVRNYFSNWLGIVVTSHSYAPGSLLVTLTIEGSTASVGSAISDLCHLIINETTFTLGGTEVALSSYLVVDGQNYYGVSCAVPPDDGLDRNTIIAIAVASTVVLLIILIVVIWRLKVHPRTRTKDTDLSKLFQGRPNTMEHLLFSENSFASIKSHGSTASSLPPVTTAAPGDLWSPRRGRSITPRSPRSVTPIDPETMETARFSFGGAKAFTPTQKDGRPIWRN